MRIWLAPMEGLADARLRAVLTRLPGDLAVADSGPGPGPGPGYDGCVAEFARVSTSALPRKVFRRLAPELTTGARTGAGTPIAVQLLGDDPDLLAATAARAATLAPAAIDLNFGCPAPLVNRHGGGAMLLDDPARLYAIVAAVRAAVPAAMPVTAKMRLGIRDPAGAVTCARALADAGAAHLVVHARTRDDRYQFPARWEWLGRIRAAVAVPVIANGDIFTPSDWARCQAISGCTDVMLGRGAVADPFLVARLRGRSIDPAAAEAALADGIADYWARVRAELDARHAPGRLKQWLIMLSRHFPGVAVFYRSLREARDAATIDRFVAAYGAETPATLPRAA